MPMEDAWDRLVLFNDKHYLLLFSVQNTLLNARLGARQRDLSWLLVHRRPIKHCMNCQNPWMVKKGREEMRFGWQNGLLYRDSIYATMHTSWCPSRSIMLTSVRCSPFCLISPKGHERSQSRGAMEGERMGCTQAE